MPLGSGNDLRTPQVRRVSTLAWRVKSVGSDHKYWPPLETAVGYKEQLTQVLLALHLVQGRPREVLEEESGDPSVDGTVADNEDVQEGLAWGYLVS